MNSAAAGARGESPYRSHGVVLNGADEEEIHRAMAVDARGTAGIIVRMKGWADPYEAVAALPPGEAVNRSVRAAAVVESLQAAFDASAPERDGAISRARAAGIFENYSPLWLINGFAARVDAPALAALKSHPGVASITPDREFTLPETAFSEIGRTPPWNLEKVFAPDVWGEFGVTGEGIIVANFDTGVDVNHPALYEKYLGHEVGHHAAWFVATSENYSAPYDGHGHGTHTMGTILGGPPGDVIGVAPGARWMAAKIFDDAGRATTSGVHAAFQWATAPGGDPALAPHVINHSWGASATYHVEYWEDVKALLAAGIFPVFSAGNDGPGEGTIGSPASFPHSFSVGATDENDIVAVFSSRGPVIWDEEVYIKPEISAPGDMVRSAFPTQFEGDPYRYASGTSMAAPHVAGVVALMLSADETLDLDEIETFLSETVRVEAHMGPVPNNSYGRGIVDAHSAVQLAAYSGVVEGRVTDEDGGALDAVITVEGHRGDFATEPGTGDYRARIGEGERTLTASSFGYISESATVNVVRGETAELDFTLREAPAHAVTGSVTAAGAPVAGARVTLKDTPVEPVFTGDDGDFDLGIVPAGSYTVTVYAPGYAFAQREIDLSGDLHLVFELDKIVQPSEPQWATFQNNYARTSYTSEHIAPQRLSPVWTYDGPGNSLFASPVVAGDLVIQSFERGRVVAVDIDTGEEVWAFSAASDLMGLRVTPTVDGGRVFVGGGNDGRFYALEAATGRRLWSFDAGQNLTYTVPSVLDGKVFFAGGWGEGDGGDVFALDVETGELIWETHVGPQVFYGPTIGGGRLYAGSYDDSVLMALDPDDGSVIWEYHHGAEGFLAAPTYAEGILFAATADFDTGRGSVLALDAATGELLWEQSGHGDAEASSPAYFDGRIFVGSHIRSTVTAYDAFTGEILWDSPMGMPVSHGLAVTGNGVVFGGNQGRDFFALDAYTGETIWATVLDENVLSTPAVSEGHVYVTTRKGTIYSFVAPAVAGGRITDEEGAPLSARVRVLETGREVYADADGDYALEHPGGDFTLEFYEYGYKQETREVFLTPLHDLVLDVTLEAGAAGAVEGTVRDEDGEPLAGVSVALPETPLDPVITDADGAFQFPSVIEGTYAVTADRLHYTPVETSVTVEAGETADLEIEMTKYVVAVIGDHEGQITRYIHNSLGVPAHERDWDIADDPDDISVYRTIVVNGSQSDPGQAGLLAFLEAADDAGISTIFLDTWGVSYGAVRYLVNHIGDPAEIGHDFNRGIVYAEKIVEQHPILDGVEDGLVNLLENNAEHAWFNDYSGVSLMKVGSGRDGWQGDVVGYELRTPTSARILLASHAASPWAGPTRGWTPAAHTLFANSLDFAINGRHGGLYGQVTDGDGQPLAATITVPASGARTATDPATGEYEMLHTPGEYEIVVRAAGYSPVTVTKNLTAGEFVELNVEMTPSGAGSLEGRITHAHTGEGLAGAQVALVGEDDISPATTDAAGYYAIDGIPEDAYDVSITLDGFMEEAFADVEITVGHATELDASLTPVPRVAVIHDGTTNKLVTVLQEMGFDAEEKTWANLGSAADYDVIHVNIYSLSTQDPGKSAFLEFMEEAAEAETSLLFPTDWSTSSGGARLLARHTGEPANIATGSRDGQIYYRVEEEHQVFGDAAVGDEINTFIHDAYWADFTGVHGFNLASLVTEDGGLQRDALTYWATGVDSVNMVLSGFGASIFSQPGRDISEDGRALLRDIILWAAKPNMAEVFGTVSHEGGHDAGSYLINAAGDPVAGTVHIVETGFEAETDPETGAFALPHPAGSWTVEVSAPGYESETVPVELHPGERFALNVELTPAEQSGDLEGFIYDRMSGVPLQGVHVSLPELRRSTTTDQEGRFFFDTVTAPGTHLKLVAKDYAHWDDWFVAVEAGGKTTVKYELLPEPRVGVLNDYQDRVAQFLESRGMVPVPFEWEDLHLLPTLDMVILNVQHFEDYDPEEEVYRAFQDAAVRAGVSVLWVGQHNRGSIRFLAEFDGDPEVAANGEQEGTLFAGITEVHPLTHPFQPGDEIPVIAGSTFGRHAYFDGYGGAVVADAITEEGGLKGQLVGYRGRSLTGVDILLGSHSISTYAFPTPPGTPLGWTPEAHQIYINALQWGLTAPSLAGEIRGTVTGGAGEPLYATIAVEETGRTYTTNPADGSYVIPGETGVATLTVTAFGHHEKTVTSGWAVGEITELDIELQPEAAGTLAGTVRSAVSGAAVPGASVTLVGTPLSAVTDGDGEYLLDGVPAGSYTAHIRAAGFFPADRPVEITAGDVTNLDVDLDPSEMVAVVGDYIHSTMAPDGALSMFLGDSGYEVERYLSAAGDPDWDDLFADIPNYRVVVFNATYFGSNPSKEQLEELLDLTADAGVSVIFTGQWNQGGIRHLSMHIGDPESTTSAFVPAAITYVVDEAHPIFDGYDPGDVLTIIEKENPAHNQQYMSFEGYSGETIGDVGDKDGERLGGGVAFKFASPRHVHVLLGGLAAGTYGHPLDTWTDDGRQVFLNAVEWAMHARLAEIYGTVTDEDSGEPIPGAGVTVLETGDQTETDVNGTYVLGVGEGTLTVRVEAYGYEPDEQTVQVEAGQEKDVSFQLTALETGAIGGTVVDAATGEPLAGVELRVEEDSRVAPAYTDDEGRYTIENVLPGEYTVAAEVTRYESGSEEHVHVTAGAVTPLDFDLNHNEVAVLGDYSEGGGPAVITAALQHLGYSAESRQWDSFSPAGYVSIVVNDAPDAATLADLIDEADNLGVSLIFLDTWGAGTGAVRWLEQVAGAEMRGAQGYGEGEVTLTVAADPAEPMGGSAAAADHPLLAGLSDGDAIMETDGYYATIASYPGQLIGRVHTEEGGDRGWLAAYSYSSLTSAHIIISVAGASQWSGPDYGWHENTANLLSNAIEWARHIEAPATPPRVEITEPEDGFLTNKEAVRVSGIATDDHGIAEVTVDGRRATVEADGSFTARALLDEGINEIEVAAANVAGLVTTVTVEVEADWTAPVLEEIEPAEDVELEWGDALTISFVSESGLDAAYQLILPAPFGTGSDAEVLVRGVPMEEGPDGRYEAVYTAPQGVIFEDAEIQINAADAAGNKVHVTAPGLLSVAEPAPVSDPELTITEPEDGFLTNKGAVRVSGTAYDESGIEEVTINGRRVDVDGDGSFTMRILLSEGPNTITVAARSNAGGETEERVIVEADWTPPVLEDMEPAEDVTLQWGETLTVRFVSEPGLTAAYQIALDGDDSSWEGRDVPIRGIPMTEVDSGVYEAVYEAPEGTAFTGAVIRFNAADPANNVTMTGAPGRLTVVEGR